MKVKEIACQLGNEKYPYPLEARRFGVAYLKVKDELQKKRNQNEPRNAKEKFGILLISSVKFFSSF